MPAKTCYAMCHTYTVYYVLLVLSARKLHSALFGIDSELYFIGLCVYLLVTFSIQFSILHILESNSSVLCGRTCAYFMYPSILEPRIVSIP